MAGTEAETGAAPDAALLTVRDLHTFYGSAHILHGVSLRLGSEPLAIMGRNGMGKTTLCHSILGLAAATKHGRVSGSITFAGNELVGRPIYRIAKSGIGYVPQGRRVFPSLTVREHLQISSRRGGRWSTDDIYDLFPRLAQRRNSGGATLSGGEQQMLVISRALLTDPKLLVMDEPSEGLAPAVVGEVVDLCQKLTREGIGLLIIEQNLTVATALARRLLIMVSGRIAVETSADQLLTDPVAQSRYLGVARQEAHASDSASS